MKIQFRILVLMFFTTQTFVAQTFNDIEYDETHQIYKESFETDNNTTLVVDLKSTIAHISQSLDNKVHIEYTMSFKNYKKKNIEYILSQNLAIGTKNNNKINFNAKKSYGYDQIYEWEELFKNHRLNKENKNDIKNETVIRKNIGDFLIEINKTDIEKIKEYLGTTKIKNSKKKWKSSTAVKRLFLNIKMPAHIKFRSTLDNSQIIFEDDFTNEMAINSKNSKLWFKKIDNPKNSFDIDKGFLKANEIFSGTYKFADVKTVQIGSLSNTRIESEFSKIEIGEIQENVSISDFNSTYWFHNWSEDFKDFILDAEYSKINLFYPKLDYELETYGINTVHYFLKNASIKAEIAPNRANKNEVLFRVDNKGVGNKIQLNIVHGIVRLDKEKIIIKD